MPTIQCSVCSAAFSRNASSIAASKSGRFFCSHKCHGAFTTAHRTFSCIQCGTDFLRSGDRVRAGRTKFCSHVCYSAHNAVGGYLNTNGYRVVYSGGKRTLEHRLVAQESIGRDIAPNEHVHHIDGNKLNNTPENLVVLSPAQHMAEHRPLTWDVGIAKSLIAAGFTLAECAFLCGVSKAAIAQGLDRRGLSVTTILRQANNPASPYGNNRSSFLLGANRRRNP